MASSSIKSGRYNFDANVIGAVLFAFPVAVLFATANLLSRFAHLLHKWERSGRTAPLPLEEQGTARLFRNCAIPFTMPAPHSWQYRDRQQEPVKLPPQVEPTFPLAVPVPAAVPAESLVLSFGTFGEFLSQEIVPNAPAPETEEVAPVQVPTSEPTAQVPTEEETSESIPVKVKTPRTRRVKVAALPPAVDAPTAPLAPVDESESIPPAAPSEAPNSPPQEPATGDDLDGMNRDDLRALRARLGIACKGASKLGSGALRVLIRQHRASASAS